MIIQEKNGVFTVEDSEKNINCTYDGTKLSGSGSRKNKQDILSEIKSFKLENALDGASNILSSSVKDDYRELSSLNFIIESLSDNITTNAVSFATIKKWQANHIKYNTEIQKYSRFLYGSAGIVTQTMNLFTGLHGLSSSLKQSNPNESNAEDDSKVKLYDSYIDKESIIRDILKEVVHGTSISYIYRKKWIQQLDIELYTPTRLIDGYWEVQCDLLKLTTANENKSIYDYPNTYQPESYNPRKEIIERQPKEIREAFGRWQKGGKQRYYNIPTERTAVIKLNAGQQERYGRSLAMGAFDDLLHKNLIRQAEEVLIDKVINQIITVTMGESGKETDGFFKPTSEQRKAVGGSIKKILNKSSTAEKEGFKIVGIPWWAKLESVSTDLDLFKSSKYEEIDQDIRVSLGVGEIFGSKDSGSYASATVSIDLFFKQIFIILEQIEDQVFNRQYLIMSKNKNNIYTRKFSRGTAIGKEKIAVLTKLFDVGGSVKYLIDEIGEDYDDYIEQVKSEKESGLHELFEPFRTSATLSNDEGGRPSEGGSGDGNNNPKPSTS